MNLNSKVLVRLMRNAYKGGGVKVYRQDNTLFISSGWWAVATPWQYVPGNVLGVLAEWLHHLPRAYEGVWCIKGNEDGFGDLTDETSGFCTLTERTAPVSDLKLLALYAGEQQAGQAADASVFWFPTDAMQMLDGSKAGELLRCEDNTLWGRWYDEEYAAVVWVQTSNRVPSKLTQKLSEYNFREGDNES